MKVLIFSYEFPPYKGGAGIYSHDLAVGLASLGIEVHVLTVNSGYDDGPVDGIHLHFLAGIGIVAAQQSLCRLQLSCRFDIVLVTERRAQENVARMPKGLFPYVAVLHGSEILSYFGNHTAKLPVARRRMAAFYENARVCITVSRATADLAGHLFPSALQCVVVPNGIDPGRLQMATTEEVRSLRQNRPHDARIVFCLGRLDLDKGHDVLIQAFASVRRSCPQAYLLIGGVGSYRAALEALCEELQLESCVEFVGEIPATILPAYFALCDVFALTSKCERRWEGFGLVYLEAGYYGKPVVGGNEGGVPEAIAHMESGLLVDPRDSHAVAASIITLLTDCDRARLMGENGRQRVLGYFNARRMAEDTLRHLDAALHMPLASNRLSGIRLRLWSFLYALHLFVDGLYHLPRRVRSWAR
jgi:glycosyltransferase involved in cell wall biosynthesis